MSDVVVRFPPYAATLGEKHKFRETAWLAARLVLGSLLLTAAGLKLYGQEVEPVSRSQWLNTPWLTFALVEWELLLGAALLAGVLPNVARWLALGTFAAFAAASFYSGWIGQASCGCFGRAAVNPWWVFGFDVAAVGALLASRPSAGERVPVGRLARVAGLSAAMLAISVGVAAGITGSAAGGLAWLRGEQVSVLPDVVDIGSRPGGTVVAVPVRLANRTGRELRVVGGTSDCSCVATDDLPLAIPAFGEADLTIRVKLPAAEGRFARSAWFWTDADDRQIAFALTGRVTAGGAE